MGFYKGAKKSYKLIGCLMRTTLTIKVDCAWICVNILGEKRQFLKP